MNDPTLNLDRLSRPTGSMAMVAMDQRDSLRTMFADAGKPSVPDETLIEFKRSVATELSPFASAFLVDHTYGLRPIIDDGLIAPSCAVVAAADSLQQEPGGPVEDTGLDEIVAAPEFRLDGVDAIKLLVIWRRDARRQARIELAERFVQLAKDRGVLSVLEPVVRATESELSAGTWNQEEAIREAARELSGVGPDLYKVQVPFSGEAENSALREECHRMDESMATPWVVLSQGVPLDRFAAAVQAACEAGASGFLAGRALWSDVVGVDKIGEALREVSLPRLKRLGDIVDQYARPWRQAISDKEQG